MSSTSISERKTLLKSECVAGASTLLTVLWIAFANPVILGAAGMDQGAVFSATCLVVGLGCLLCGIYARAPVAIGPGMALAVYFSYSVVQGMGVSWQQALAMVCVSGVLFGILSLTRLLQWLVEAIPVTLQVGILVGISLLIALIALRTSGIIVSDGLLLMHLADFHNAHVPLFFGGFLLIMLLDYYQVPGAIILGILGTSALSLLSGLSPWHGITGMPPALTPALFAPDFAGIAHASVIKPIFAFFLIALFDATGTLMGLLTPSLFATKELRDKTLCKCLRANALATIAAGFIGTANTSPMIESAAGIAAGGRTGLSALVTGAGFLLLLFFYPLAQAIPVYAVGPALLFVACSMMRNISHIDWSEPLEALPAALTILLIPFSGSVADGIGAGVLTLTLARLLTRRHPGKLLLGLSAVFVVFFAIQ
ncbi:xanthine/uracil permease [Legionella geestiana]|uniref:Xanthine/uracil permease n=1 Tax=Legionella geestiana TaxID=45065 RepID=A0A0W0TNZ3_9GAMM|nr:NCS2 family permease [Legionella geestiana]KTC97310.1 xanthine/uracil permease [Legionella geestiana]QBS12437.1 NCS2 family permease [Legionella geestiana]STX55122.1 xanthine/uracil permease [Legionella geestiana]